jgi:hypothetical protein
MSNDIIFVLMYHCHKLLDLMKNVSLHADIAGLLCRRSAEISVFPS